MGFSPFEGFGAVVFSIMPIIVPLIVACGFMFVFGTIIARSIRGAKQRKKNNNSPVLTVDAKIVAKRADVHQYRNNTGTNNLQSMSSSTTYYATFEVASGDRFELKTHDTDYGMLVENDFGKLTFQGTRYLGFERVRS